MLPDLFRRLKPLYGKAIDLLWIEYQTADVERKREIEETIMLLATKKLGIAIGEEQLVLDAPPPGLIGAGEFTIGNVSYPSIPPYPFRVARNELLRHIFILGPTGTGKSTLLLNLLVQVQAAGVPFMAFDFKRNYRCLLRAPGAQRLVVITVGRKTAPLAINALSPPPGVEFGEWSEALADIISTSYLLLQGARNVLKEAMQQAHAQHKESATLGHVYELLSRELDATRSGSRRYGWLESSTRSVEELTKGALGDALNATTGTTITDLLARSVVFELHGFGDDQKRFFCLYWLQAVLLLRKNSSARRESLQHLLIFDEAHNVFPRERLGEVSIPARLAREVREYGEGIIAATQQADVSESLIANSGFKLILRCDYPKDVQFASQLLQLDARWLPRLPIGTGIARLPVRFYLPILFTFTVQPIKNLTISEEEVHDQWTKHALARIEPGVRKIEVSNRGEQLLRDVNEHPISTITERYERLGWHPQVGNRVKDDVIAACLAEFREVNTRRARVKLLTLTPAGLTYLSSKGVDISRARHGGPEHEWWKRVLREDFEKRGYAVTDEFSLGGGRTADLRAEKNGHVVFVEVETGRSDIPGNVAKYDGRQEELIVFFTSEEIAAKHRDLIALQHPAARCLTPTDRDAIR